MKSKTLSVRGRDSEQQILKVEEFIKKISKEVESKK